MITGIPKYQSPAEQSLRCPCGRFYLVYVGSGDSAAAEAQAERLNAIFVDSRLTPFINCECGQALEFAGEETIAIH